MVVKLSISKDDIYEEVAKTTSYTGSKKDQLAETDTPKAYDTMATTDEDADQLDRFWQEGWIQVGEALKRYIDNIPSTPTIISSRPYYTLSLMLPSNFDTGLSGVMCQELHSFMINFIIAKWFAFTSKTEATEYAQEAGSLLEGLQRKACCKVKPSRPTYN